MFKKPTYEELEQRVQELEKESVERRTLEHALRESQERLELAVDGANLAMWDWNVKTGKVEYSQCWAEILGYFPEEIKPHVSAWEELVHPEDMPQVMQKLNANLEGFISFYECEHRLKAKSGEWVWVQARGKVVERDNDGKPLRHTGTQFDINDRVIAQEALKEARDALEQKVAERTTELVSANELLKQEITERKQVEEALSESEERYRLLADNVTDVIWTRDLNLNLTYISPSIMNQQGFTVEEAMNRTMEEALTPDSFKVAEEIFAEELEIERSGQKDMERSRTIEVEIKCKDGSTILAEIKMAFLRDPDGKAVGIIGVTRNITERKQAEEALRESEEKYRTVIETSLDPIVVYNMEGKVTYFNPAFTRVFGWTLGERLGKKMDLFVPDDNWPETQKMLKKALAGENFSGFETRRYTKEGDIIHVSISTAIYKDQNGNPVGSVINLRDITEQKKMEAQLQQALKMESIGTLAGGIAHDFNNILGIIIGNTELTIDDVPEWNPARRNLEEIRTASLRARDVVRQLLSFARKTELEKIPVNIAPIVKESLKLLRASTPTSIDIRQDISEDLDTILADSTQVNQVLINLCTNADHAMPDGGILGVVLKNLELGEDLAAQYPDLNPGRYVNLAISDQGHGIPSKEIVRIFDPYFTTKKIGKGTGMGLAVVHGIVKGHNGEIIVESEPGKGTKFNIFFPVVDKEAVVGIETIEKLPTGSERILFIDDEISIVNVVKQILKRLGYQVETKTSPTEAVDLFRVDPGRFDLVVTDMTMPELTGDKLMKKMLNIRQDTPIILCTGFNEKIDEINAKEIGATDYIEKPFDKRDFAFKVRKVLDAEVKK